MIPDTESQKAASAVVQEVFGDRIKNLSAQGDALSLVEELRKSALDPSCDAATMYILLNLAKDVAIKAGDGGLALEVIDKIEERFVVDVHVLRQQTMLELVKTTRSPVQRTNLAAACFDLMEEAIQTDDLASARLYGKHSTSFARGARHSGLIRYAVANEKALDEVESAYAAIKPSIAALNTNVTDAEANRAVGEYSCFIKGAWKEGLPMLALGSDTGLSKVATMELRVTASPDDQLALADAWWDVAEKYDGRANRVILLHAAASYSRAVPDLTGISKSRVEKRLSEIRQATASDFLWLADPPL